MATAQEVLDTLREAGYKITPPGQHTQSYNPRHNIIREKLADPNECAHLLDRSQPKPDWAKGKEEQILKELEIQLLGYMDAQHPFGR